MKPIGMIRRIDSMGRLVLPKVLRRKLKIEKQDYLEIFVQGDRVLLSKYEPECALCGQMEALTTFKDKVVCHACLEDLKKLEVGFNQ